MAQFDGIRAHVLAKPGQGAQMVQRANQRQGAQLGLAGEQAVGQTAHFIVYTDGTPDGNATAQAVLQAAEPDFTAVQSWFGGLQLPPGHDGDNQTTVRTALPMQVGMDAQAGGAYHYSCDGTDLFIAPVPSIGGGLVVAEVVEVFQAAQGRGWDCGHTNGEGLSRVLAFERYPNLAPDFVNTEQFWWANGHADYVNDNSATDTDEAGNGCGTLFLFYLHSQLGFTWNQIVAAAGPTLGATYQQLVGNDPQAGFQDFVQTLSSIASGTQLNVPSSGNPFPIGQAGSGTPAAGSVATSPTGGSSGSSLTMVSVIIGVLVIIALAYFLLHH